MQRKKHYLHICMLNFGVCLFEHSIQAAVTLLLGGTQLDLGHTGSKLERARGLWTWKDLWADLERARGKAGDASKTQTHTHTQYARDASKTHIHTHILESTICITEAMQLCKPTDHDALAKFRSSSGACVFDGQKGSGSTSKRQLIIKNTRHLPGTSQSAGLEQTNISVLLSIPRESCSRNVSFESLDTACTRQMRKGTDTGFSCVSMSRECTSKCASDIWQTDANDNRAVCRQTYLY